MTDHAAVQLEPIEPPSAWVQPVAAAGLIATVAALAGLLWRHELLASHPAGLTVQAAAVALWFWARLTFGGRSFNAGPEPTPGALLTRGPYRWWRHPLYAAIIWFTVAAAATHRTWPAAAAMGVVVLGLGGRMWAEERLLRRAYPDEYPAYAARTRRLIPGVL